MSERDLRQSVSRFFKEQSLPQSRAARLSALANAANEGAPANSSVPRWPVFIGALVTCVVITAFVTAYLVSSDGGPEGTTVEFVQQDAPPIRGTESEVGDDRTPRLVAVSTTAAWCPMCPRMTPVYKQLVERYGERPVLFVVFDMTDDAARKQTELLATTLGIEWLCKEKIPTGTINLVDREKGVVLASVTQPDQLDSLIGSLDKALP